MSDSNPPVSTGRGDDGTTTLLGSGRMGKNDPRIVVLGDVDEASSFLGLARAEAGDEIGDLLLELQRLLYRIMGDVAMPGEENAVGEGRPGVRRRRPARVARQDGDPQGVRRPRREPARGPARRLPHGRQARRAQPRRGRVRDEHPLAIRAVNRVSDLLFVVARNADGRKTLSKS